MFFCKLGRVVAWLVFLLGTFKVTIGLMGARGMLDISQYAPVRTTGEAIDEGAMAIGAAIIIGAISEIGLLLAKRRDTP